MAIDTYSPQDLPIWMRRALRATDWGALLSIAFSILIALPILMQPSLPHTNAGEHYVFQTANIATALQEGRLWPRWAPHALGGYGAPIPHYYPQAAGYLAALFQIVLTGSPVFAVQVVHAIALIGAGMLIYTWVARRAGAQAGLLANILYSFSPYVGLVAPHVLGDLPGVVCHMLLPLLLWSLDRVLTTRHPIDLIVTGLTTSLLLITDIRYAALSCCLALVYVAWDARTQPRRAVWRYALVALLLGAGVASFFWLPALTERDAVMWRSIMQAPDYRLSFENMLAPLRQTDPAELTPTPQFTLGFALVAFTIGGIFWIALTRAWKSLSALFLGCGVALALIALLRLPDQTWLLGGITFCFAIAASASARLRMHFRPRRRFALGLLGSLVLLSAALPIWLFPFSRDDFGGTSGAAQIQYELQGFGIAGLPPGLPLPTTLSPNLVPNRALLESYTGREITKIDTLYLNSNVQLGFLEHTSNSDRIQVQTYAPTSITVLTAHFPGWRVSTTAGAVSVNRDEQTGLISLDIPNPLAGELTISLESTPARAIGWAVSWLMHGLLIFFSRRQYQRREDSLAEYPLLTRRESQAGFILLAAMTALALLGYGGALDPLRTQPNQTLTITLPLNTRTDAGLEAAAFQLSKPTYQAGETLNLTLYWRALRFLDENYRVQVALVDPADGEAVIATDIRSPSLYPTRRWLPSRFVADRYALHLPADLPAGDYALRVEAFSCADSCTRETRLAFFGENGTPLGRSLLLPALIPIAP